MTANFHRNKNGLLIIVSFLFFSNCSTNKTYEEMSPVQNPNECNTIGNEKHPHDKIFSV